ncbi:MAG: pilus (MSHA type) biogenesis protein MshL [Granulosicoccus sp.]
MRNTRAKDGAVYAIRAPIAVLFLLFSAGCAVDIAQLPHATHELAHSARLAPNLSDKRPETFLNEPQGKDLTASLQGRSLQELEGDPIAVPTIANDTTERFDINAVDAPIGALLYSLAAKTNIQMHVTGELEGRVTLKTIQATLPDILRQLADQAPFTWVVEESKLAIWSGKPFRYSYSVDYLNIQRSTTSSVGLATQVGTINAANSSGDSIANSSRTHIENSSSHDFWASIEKDLELLLSDEELVDSSVTDFSINAEAGLITLFASPELHQSVKKYLHRLHRSTQRQVLIEASVVEVTLSDSFEAGIDWQLIAKGLSGISAAQILAGAPTVTAETVGRLASPAGLVSMVHRGGDGDLTATLSLLERFGDVKILSRPRIIALNNQASVLKVVDNRVYFTAKVERSQTDTKSEIVTQTEIHTVPVGLVMNVTPQISGDGAIMLNVRPTLSRILGFVNDPNPELALANIKNGVPEIQVREMESMLRVQSGEVAVIGGLMQESEELDQSQLPGLGRVPLLKSLFSHRKKTKRQTELLIVLRPTIVELAADARS